MPFCCHSTLNGAVSSALRGVSWNSAFYLSLPFSIQALAVPDIILRHKQYNYKHNSTVSGKVLRPSSIHSVPEATFWAFDCPNNHSTSNPIEVFLSRPYQRQSMAASSSEAVIRDVFVDELSKGRGGILNSSKPFGVAFNDRRFLSCQNASMSWRSQEKPKSRQVLGYFMFNAIFKNFKSNPITWPWMRNFQSSFSTQCAGGAVPDVSFDGSSNEEHVANPSASQLQNILGDSTLKLVSGSCYLPHPDKEEKGGEDAHFICVDEQAIGVADGVGGWAEVGVDSGEFARELMSYSVNAIQEEPKGCIDPAKVLEKAHSSTRAKGSSTACIIALTNQGIHAINLGDSGFIVVRDGGIVFESPVQQHDFNFTYQLESGSGGDLPSSGQVFTIPVAAGDVVVAGTDGLFDNLYNKEVVEIVMEAMKGGGAGPLVMAEKIAVLARRRAQDSRRQTPFATAAQEAGFRYYGGKLDDITVVVSCITRAASE